MLLFHQRAAKSGTARQTTRQVGEIDLYLMCLCVCVFINILHCQVHFYYPRITLQSLSLSCNIKGESATHTHTHTFSDWSPLQSAPSLVNVQCDSRVTEGQISSVQLILSQKQTSASDPPTTLTSDLIFLGLSFSPLQFLFFLSLCASKRSHSVIIVRPTGREVQRYYHLLKRAFIHPSYDQKHGAKVWTAQLPVLPRNEIILETCQVYTRAVFKC